MTQDEFEYYLTYDGVEKNKKFEIKLKKQEITAYHNRSDSHALTLSNFETKVTKRF